MKERKREMNRGELKCSREQIVNWQELSKKYFDRKQYYPAFIYSILATEGLMYYIHFSKVKDTSRKNWRKETFDFSEETIDNNCIPSLRDAMLQMGESLKKENKLEFILNPRVEPKSKTIFDEIEGRIFIWRAKRYFRKERGKKASVV